MNATTLSLLCCLLCATSLVSQGRRCPCHGSHGHYQPTWGHDISSRISGHWHGRRGGHGRYQPTWGHGTAQSNAAALARAQSATLGGGAQSRAEAAASAQSTSNGGSGQSNAQAIANAQSSSGTGCL